MITESKVRHIVEDKIKETENFLVDINVSVNNKINVWLDNDKGVSINDCVQVSRYLETSLNREVEDFELTVSSPGLDMPFKIFRQYLKNIGKQVHVLTKDGQKITGKLNIVKEEGIEVEQIITGKSHKTKETNHHFLGFDQIKETKLIIAF